MKKPLKTLLKIILASLLTIFLILLWREFSPNDFAKVYLPQIEGNTYHFNEDADLIKATLSQQTIHYEVDGGGLRVSKHKNGKLLERYYWAERDQLIMISDSDDYAKFHFHYKKGFRVPTSFTDAQGKKYYIRYDQSQSPRIIQNSANQIIKVMDYDNKGQRIKESRPAFIFPLGFAGGLYDPDTQLIYYRQGDYHPASGQWIAKRSQIDLVDNFKQLAQQKREDVFHCVHYLGDYPHAYLCTQYHCGSLYPNSRNDYFNGTGSILDNTPYFQPKSCDAITLDKKCNAPKFSQCVAEKIQPRKGEPFDTLRHNCFHAVNEIIAACRLQSCTGESK